MRTKRGGCSSNHLTIVGTVRQRTFSLSNEWWAVLLIKCQGRFESRRRGRHRRTTVVKTAATLLCGTPHWMVERSGLGSVGITVTPTITVTATITVRTGRGRKHSKSRGITCNGRHLAVVVCGCCVRYTEMDMLSVVK